MASTGLRSSATAGLVGERHRTDPPDLGAEVEVRNRFDRHWVGGFVVHAVLDGGRRYRIRRDSDGAVLPAVFDAADIRRRGSAPGVFSPFRR